MASAWLQQRLSLAAHHSLLVLMTLISVCVLVFFAVGYGAAQRWLDPLVLQLRKLSANEAVPSCVLALVLIYAISAEWLGSVAGITGAYLLGYVFAGSELKADVERSFYAIGHGLLIPLFFVSIGLSSDYRALAGHWTLLFAIFVVAIVSKLVGCGLAALGSGMSWVRSVRIGCGMISRGEVGLIVTAMGASTGIFGRSDVAVMVAVVLLTTLVTPLLLRGAFQLKDGDDLEGANSMLQKSLAMTSAHDVPQPAVEPDEAADESTEDGSDRIRLYHARSLAAFPGTEPISE
jgi:Kef-type K+ transport system membrane component KefB